VGRASSEQAYQITVPLLPVPSRAFVLAGRAGGARTALPAPARTRVSALRSLPLPQKQRGGGSPISPQVCAPLRACGPPIFTPPGRRRCRAAARGAAAGGGGPPGRMPEDSRGRPARQPLLAQPPPRSAPLGPTGLWLRTPAAVAATSLLPAARPRRRLARSRPARARSSH
jgi:hypothetical protein